VVAFGKAAVSDERRTPRVGDVVHMRTGGRLCRAAVVTAVGRALVSLEVFGEPPQSDLRFRHGVAYGPGDGQWHWIH
jgi:hypothetical protein